MASRASSGLLVKQVHHLWSGTWTTVFATFILRTLLLYCVSDELCVCIRASQLIFRPSNLHPLHFVRPSSRRATAAILFFSFLVIFLSACDCSSTIMISSARLPKFETTPNPICCGDSGGRAGFLTKPYKCEKVQVLECELVLAPSL